MDTGRLQEEEAAPAPPHVPSHAARFREAFPAESAPETMHRRRTAPSRSCPQACC